MNLSPEKESELKAKVDEYNDEHKDTGMKIVAVVASKVKNKRFAAIVNDGTKSRIINFGSKNGVTFLDGADESKRAAFQARHSKIRVKDGIDVPFSPSSLAYYLLW